MQIPSPNISAYRRQYSSFNQRAQLIPTLCNPDVRNPRFIGEQRALIAGIEDEGAPYRGYGCYASNAPCNCCNNNCPVYYNAKSSYQGRNDWFVADRNG